MKLRKISIKIGYLLAIFLFSISFVKAAEIKADISVNMEQLLPDYRMNVSSMEYDVRNYINNQEFLTNEWKGSPIPVNISIFLSGGANNIYAAKIVIISKRVLDGPSDVPGESVELKIFDDKWTFEYGKGSGWTYNPLRYDSFTTLLDFYMLLIIGFDLDTYSELGGSQAFDIAKNIASTAASSNGYGFNSISEPGQFTKYNLIRELTDMRYNDFRKLMYAYYVIGLDKMAFSKDDAVKNIQNVIDDMASFKKNKLSSSSILIQAFFDNKAQEIASIFKGYSDKSVFDNLMYLDPSNSMIYRDAMEGR